MENIGCSIECRSSLLATSLISAVKKSRCKYRSGASAGRNRLGLRGEEAFFEEVLVAKRDSQIKSSKMI